MKDVDELTDLLGESQELAQKLIIRQQKMLRAVGTPDTHGAIYGAVCMIIMEEMDKMSKGTKES